ncbi:MAG: hypothetical protein V3V08_17945 [Nannocystaceae bacterium]
MQLSSVFPNEVTDAVFERAPDPLLILGADGLVVVAMNGAARRWLGHYTSLLEMLDHASLVPLSPEYEGGTTLLSVRTRSGSESVEAVYIPVQAENRRFWIVTLRGTAALEERCELRSQRVEMVGELAGGLARNFKNVLQAIGLISEQLDSREGEQAQIITRGVADALTVGGELLATWHALASPSPERRSRRVDLTKLVQRCEKLVRLLTGSLQQVRFEYPREAAEIAGDEAQLVQIVMTLCLRARDSVARSGGASFDVALIADGDEIRLIVRDDGDPLSVVELGLIARRGDPSARLDRSSRALASVLSLVEPHGGTLQAGSPRPGAKGAELSVRWRRAANPEVRSCGRSPTDTTMARRRDSIWTHVHDVS